MKMTSAEYRESTTAPKRGKFGNVPNEVDGIRFASKREAKRYGELKLLERARIIGLLKLQPRYRLTVNGVLISTYVADFEYWDTRIDRHVTEDAKGVSTPVFKLKAKLFYAITGRKVDLI